MTSFCNVTPPPGAHAIHGLAIKTKTCLRLTGQCVLRRRRPLSLPRRSNQFVNTVYVTPTEGIMTQCSFWRPRANIRSGIRAHPTQLAQLALAHLGPIHRQGLLPTCSHLRSGGGEFYFLRKVLLGQRRATTLAKSMSTRTEDVPKAFKLPNRFSRTRRTLNKRSGSPQPRVPAICVAMAPRAPPDLRSPCKEAD